MANLWPTSPAPFPTTFEVSGYSEELPMNIVQTSPEAGARIVRKRFTAMPTKISGTMILTPAQVTTLKLFFKQQQALRWRWTTDLTTPTEMFYDFAEPVRFTALSGNNFRASMVLWQFTTEFGGS